MDASGHIRTSIYAIVALTAFASNSLLCRYALVDQAIDAGSFSVIRLASGAAVLWMILILSGYRKRPEYNGSWFSAGMLFLYAFAFSFAYIDLHAGTGALILFGAVQLTMLTAGVIQGERPRLLQWTGLLVAVAGLVYLVAPGITAPPLRGSILMTLSGIAWGIYSLRGRRNIHPVAVTTDNFIRTVPFVCIAGLVFLPLLHVTPIGALLAVISGSITSALGYIVWYAALRGLSSTRAAIIQLSVPILAAFGGVLLLSESVTLRLMISASLTLGGVAVAIFVSEKRREG